MPWSLPADLKRFKEITIGSPVIMGRNTYESIGSPLPGRLNIIISRNPLYVQSGCLVFASIQNAIESCQLIEEVFVIGGATLYEQTIGYADKIYLTEIHEEFKADTFFPEIDHIRWEEKTRETFEEALPYSFVTYEPFSNT